jgi:hypothetical protein
VSALNHAGASRLIVFPAGTGAAGERLRIVATAVLADSLPPRGMGDAEQEYATHLELLERLEVRSAMARAGLL